MERDTTLRDTFRRYVDGQLSESETRAFLAQIQSQKDRELIEELLAETLERPVDLDQQYHARLQAVLDGSWQHLQRRIDQEDPLPRRVSWRKALRVAALLVCILSAGIALYLQQTWSEPIVVTVQPAIVPGQQTATLTLADGRKIRLTDTDNGQLAEDAGVRISKSADGQLVYDVQQSQGAAAGYNTLATAKGETYKVLLPDGTQVWLNAASSIRYPVHFSAQTTRRVELTGEAYFDVAKKAKQPFVVYTAGQQVKVLGTRFNINSYADESHIRTTLLEGSVVVDGSGKTTTLRPGQQATVGASGNIQVLEVDAEPVVSWVHNEFMFDGDDIQSVMRKIARWYNVEVVYQGAKTTEKFGGGLSRFEEVEQVLQLLEKTGAVRFRVEGKTIYVLP